MTLFLPFTRSSCPALCRTSRFQWPNSAMTIEMAGTDPAMTPCVSVVILEALGQFLDVLRRPAGDFHAEMQAHLDQHFLDLVERLAAEIRRAQHLGLGLLHEVADIDDVVVLETVGRTHRQLELVDLLEEGGV